ncbi:MAG: hypothetical protein WAK55_30950 [Xanthobacteraceae bacterium]
MRSHVLYSALGLVLVACPTAAGAQTVIAPDYYGQPAGAVIVPQRLPVTATVPQPAETVQTTQTVHTVRHVPAQPAHRQIVTTRTVTRRVVPAPAAVAATVPAAPPPAYDVAVPAVAPAPVYDVAVPAALHPIYDTTVPQPLYDAAAPASSDDYYSGVAYDSAPEVAAPAPAGPILYRYVYEPDRILVIDPVTNIAVQAIPR